MQRIQKKHLKNPEIINQLIEIKDKDKGRYDISAKSYIDPK